MKKNLQNFSSNGLEGTRKMYLKPQVKALGLDTEDMICVSVDSSIDPGDFDMGDGGELSKDNQGGHYNVWED